MKSSSSTVADRPRIDTTSGTRFASEDETSLAKSALRDLEIHRLLVVLVPAQEQHHEGHMVRTVENRNPAWYREFVKGRWDNRGCQVKRFRVVRALERTAIRGIVRRNGYEVELLKFLHLRRAELERS